MRNISINIDGTCEWLLTSHEYESWLEERGLLLIRGHPGSGKSTLLKFPLESLSESGIQVTTLTISHFFYPSGTEIQKDLEGQLRSLILQLSVNDDESKSSVHDFCRKRLTTRGKKKSGQLICYQSELQAIFEKLVLACSARRVVRIFIDAIDECRDQDREEIAKFFHRLRPPFLESLGRPWIYFTCRHCPESQIEAEFQILLDSVNWTDIVTYIDRELRLPEET